MKTIKLNIPDLSKSNKLVVNATCMAYDKIF